MKTENQERKEKMISLRENLELNMLKYRILATGIDILILTAFLSIIMIPISLFLLHKITFLIDNLYNLQLYAILFIISFILYTAIFESSKYKGTIGQMLFNIKILDSHSKKLSFIKSCRRNIIKLLFFPFLFIYVIYHSIIYSLIIPIIDYLGGVKIIGRNERDDEMF